MEISEAQNLRNQIGEDIFEMLVKYEKETGTTVTSINIEKSVNDFNESNIIDVNINVTL